MSEEANTIAKNKVVRLNYVLRGDDGQTIDESGDEPLEYLHGAGNIVPGLEKQLEGKTTGDKVTAVVPPEEGYGPRHKIKPHPIPRSKFPEDVELEKGMGFTMRAENGQPVPVWITKIQGPTVYVDPNHPLAGETLHFDVEVLDIREANEEEIAHGHPHGPDGHHH